MTALDLICRSLRLLGVINIGEVPTAAEQADALLALNAMVDAWATQRLLMYTTARNIYPLVIGQSSYQIGPSGPDWTADRPVRIDAATLLIVNSDPTQSYERPLHIVPTNEEWARVRMKGLQSTLPQKLFYDSWFSNADSATSPVGSGNIAVWPVPTQVNDIVLYTPAVIHQFTGLTQTIALPPGYARALPYNLALELAPEFDRQPSPVVVQTAMDSLDDIKRLAVPGAIGRLRSDIALQSNGGAFDWLIGETR